MAWTTLREIRDENRRLRDEESREAPVECPHDGTPLERGPRGVMFCPMGDYRVGA